MLNIIARIYVSLAILCRPSSPPKEYFFNFGIKKDPNCNNKQDEKNGANPKEKMVSRLNAPPDENICIALNNGPDCVCAIRLKKSDNVEKFTPGNGIQEIT